MDNELKVVKLESKYDQHDTSADFIITSAIATGVGALLVLVGALEREPQVMNLGIGIGGTGCVTGIGLMLRKMKLSNDIDYLESQLGPSEISEAQQGAFFKGGGTL